ncbi:MAG: hypothetical protein WBF77_09030 [Sulfurimonadaceae bacterium]
MKVNSFLIAIILLLSFSHAVADEYLPDSINHDKEYADKPEIGIEIGALIFIGLDFRVYYRKSDSPWVFGVRYLDIEDDFMNESVAGLPEEESDKEYTKRYGIYFDYLFNRQTNTGSFYLTGALYKTTQTIECYSESGSDSAIGPYFGGGYRGSFGDHFGYDIGLHLSPFVKLEPTTSNCSSKSDGDFDANLGLIIKF